MRKPLRYSLPAVLCLLAAACFSCLIYRMNINGKVVTSPAPAGETPGQGYDVTVNGKSVSIYTGYAADADGGDYAFASFDFSGSVVVRITSDRDLQNLCIQPESAAVKTSVEGNVLTLRLKKPCNISVEPDAKDNPLLLFANPIEKSQPRRASPDVIYYGPGSYHPDVIRLKSNQILYIAGGAVVKGGVEAEGRNIKIMGRGILCGIDWPHEQGPCENLINITDSSHVRVEGVTLRGSWGWTAKVYGSDHVSFSNVKVVGGRVINDDGIDVCNSRDVTISGCFIRTDDDCIALKGLDKAEGNVDDITIRSCVLWGDGARILLAGHESRAEYMRHITVDNCDIVHYSLTPFLFEPGEEMTIENVLVENVRVHRENQVGFITLRPTVNQFMVSKVPGAIRNCTFRNISVTGTYPSGSAPEILVLGYDGNHTVENVRFQNIRFNRAAIGADSPGVTVGKYTKGIGFS